MKDMHVVLLGDSIFDNGAYTSGGADVITQLRHLLPTGWRATLGAVDGATTTDLDPQLAAVPEDARHRVLSVGGNDALAHVDLLDRRSRSSAQVLGELADAAEAFEKRYRKEDRPRHPQAHRQPRAVRRRSTRLRRLPGDVNR